MLERSIPFAILDLIVSNDPVLTRVEEMLRVRGHAKEASALNKLQQDVGLKVANDIGDPDSEDLPAYVPLDNLQVFLADVDPADAEKTRELIQDFGLLLPERLKILEAISDLFRWEEAFPDYVSFMQQYRDLKVHQGSPEQIAAFKPPAPGAF